MNRESYINIVFHQVTVKIDEGPVFKMYKKELSAENCYPINIFKELYQFTNTIFLEFLELLKQESHNLTFQDNENGTYFPLLDNDKNGAIDLTWTKSQIIEFINAFSFPYKGAFVFYKQDKVFFRNVLVRNDEINFHPFSIGLIVNKTDNYLDFIVNDGILRVSEILNVDSESIDFCLFNLGDRFYMPQDELLKAKLYRPSNKKFILKVN